MVCTLLFEKKCEIKIFIDLIIDYQYIFVILQHIYIDVLSKAKSEITFTN
jgi:hypothetical protein